MLLDIIQHVIAFGTDFVQGLSTVSSLNINDFGNHIFNSILQCLGKKEALRL